MIQLTAFFIIFPRETCMSGAISGGKRVLPLFHSNAAGKCSKIQFDFVCIKLIAHFLFGRIQSLI